MVCGLYMVYRLYMVIYIVYIWFMVIHPGYLWLSMDNYVCLNGYL